MNYLLKVTNTYRVPDEAAALNLREELTNLPTGELTSFSYAQKQVKQKGEIVDEYLICKATLEFQKEKEADTEVSVTYEVEA